MTREPHRDLTLVPIGPVPPDLLERLAAFLEGTLGLSCGVSLEAVDPAPAYDRQRGQVDTRRLLATLEERADALGSRVLGVADVDLYAAIFTFVFGEAKLRGRAGLFSLHRLRPALYGLPEDPELLEGRARREALHETGHLLGLVHCRRPDCVMRFSGSAEEVDLKPDALCPPCRDTLEGMERGASREEDPS
jgi:archaemetzincin